MDWLIEDVHRTGEILMSVFILNVLLLIIVRASGVRSFAKMTGVDFASTIAVGSILGGTVISSFFSIYEGIVAVIGLVLFQNIFTFLTSKFKRLDKMSNNSPLMLICEGEIIYENLKKIHLGEDELMAKLRESNVSSLSQVKAVVMETTGSVSVITSDSNQEVEDVIMKGVVK